MDRRTFIQVAAMTGGVSQVGGFDVTKANEPENQQRLGGYPPRLARTKTAFYLSDLDQCLPSSALNSEGKRHCWRKIAYETDGFHGVLLMAGEETEAEEVTYPLKVDGWHDVYIGMFNTSWRPYASQLLWAKLENDPAFSCLYLAAPPDEDAEAHWIRDVYWKTANLSGQRLSFKQPCKLVVPEGQAYGDVCHELWVAYIRLIPLTEEETRVVREDQEQTRTKRLFAYNDCFSFIFDRGENAPGEARAASVRAQLEPYRNSDFSRIYWDAALGDQTFYFSKIGRLWTRQGVHAEDFARTGDRLLVEAWGEYFRNGIDPFRVAAESSHEVGLEFHACFRLGGGMGAFYWPPPFDGYNKGGFYETHQELRCVRRDGTPAPRISFAFPETQQFVLSLLEEMTTYPIDGVCMLFNRQPPLLEYESPLVDGFKAKYGQDPRQLDEKDPRWLAYRCATLTGFMRELRQRLNASALSQNRSKPFTVSAWVSGIEDENIYYGLDVKTWIKEGLVDTLIPYTSAKNLYSGDLAWENPRDVEQWVNLTRNTNCQLALNILPRNLDAKQYHRKAHQLYQAGVGYLAIWDTPVSPVLGMSSADVVRRLGHQEEVAALVAAGEPNIHLSGSRLRKLAGWEMTFIPE